MPKPLMLIIVIFRLLPTRDLTLNIVVILVPKDAVSVNIKTLIMAKTLVKILVMIIKLKVALSAQVIQLLHALLAKKTTFQLLLIFVFPALLVQLVVLVILLLKILTTKLPLKTPPILTMV